MRRATTVAMLTAALLVSVGASPSVVFAAPAQPTLVVAKWGTPYAPGSACNNPNFNTVYYPSDDDAIQAAIDSSSDGDAVYICAGTYYLDNELSIAGGIDLTIRGDGIGATILDGGDSVRAINANPISEYDEGGLLSLRDLSIRDTSIDEYELGGAVFADSVTLDRVSIDGNAEAYNGGGIYAEGNVIVRDSTFADNVANRDGAAIYAWHGARSTFVLRSTFTDNHAGNQGGAISSAGSLVVDYSTFTGNDAGEDGGAIKSQNAMTIRRSTFDANDSLDGVGGAIFAQGNGYQAIVANSTFRDNHAYAIGGAIEFQYFNNISITDTLFYENWAERGFGGAIQAYSNSNITIRSSRFIGNHADGGLYGGNGNGGAMDACALYGLTIESSAFESNASSGWGGALGLFGDTCGETGPVTIRSSRFVSNTALGNGGAIWLGGELRMLANSLFAGNASGGRGGAVYMGSSFGYPGSIGTISRTTFRANSAQLSGGALYVPGTLSAATGNVFEGNITWGSGGAVHLYGTGVNSWSKLRSNRFVANGALVHGAAIYLSGASLSAGDLRKLGKANRYSGDPYACGGVGEVYPASGC